MGKTGYFTHRDCWKHDMGAGHPECPARLDAIEDRLLVTGVGDALQRGEAPLATLQQITRAHSVAHMEHLEALSQRLIEDAPAGEGDATLALAFLGIGRAPKSRRTAGTVAAKEPPIKAQR